MVSIEIVGGYGYVTTSLVVHLLLNMWMNFQVVQARKKYNVPYPTMYAHEADNKDAKAFNCVQRGHQNTLEFMPIFFVNLLVGGLQYPRIAAALGFVYTVTRYLYFKGYATGSAPARYAYGGRFLYPAMFGLLGCTIAFTLHQFFPDLV